MPTLWNVGSINIDWVYRLPRIVRPGETLGTASLERFAGGKGANQSVAAARAGQGVAHVGCVGADGVWLRELLDGEGIDVTTLRIAPDTPTGHAIIQVDDAGENAILLFPGTNHAITRGDLDDALRRSRAGDWMLTQNETANAVDVLGASSRHGLKLVFNPAPITKNIAAVSLEGVEVLVVNEHEAAAFTDMANEEQTAIELGRKVRGLAVVTLGARGAVASDGRRCWRDAGHHVADVVDTTGAGDTFTGYLTASLMRGDEVTAALRRASVAAALSVTRAGAIPSIPRCVEVDALTAT